MVTIQLDDATAAALWERARLAGYDLQQYLKALAGNVAIDRETSWDHIERELDALSSPGAGIPEDFSRADIYAHHD